MDLWRFAKLHDRRSYQLLRFCIAPESDYRTVVKAIVSVSRPFACQCELIVYPERVYQAH